MNLHQFPVDVLQCLINSSSLPRLSPQTTHCVSPRLVFHFSLWIAAIAHSPNNIRSLSKRTLLRMKTIPSPLVFHSRLIMAVRPTRCTTCALYSRHGGCGTLPRVLRGSTIHITSVWKKPVNRVLDWTVLFFILTSPGEFHLFPRRASQAPFLFETSLFPELWPGKLIKRSARRRRSWCCVTASVMQRDEACVWNGK